MKYFLFALIALVPGMAHADEASHRAAAVKFIETITSKDLMRQAFMSMLDPLISGQNAPQVSPAELADMKQAMVDWFDQDFKWEDLRAQMADIYMKSFTEDELNQLTAFYNTPLGKKTLTELPQLMKQGAQLGVQYAESKQTELMARLQKVQDKYHPTVHTPAPAQTTPSKS